MIEVVLLGPVEIRRSGRSIGLTPLERGLLAILALSRGTVVSTERIIDVLWGDNPPAAPRSRVQGLVSNLRRKVGVVLTRHPGYLLDSGDLECDLQRCEELLRDARTAPPATAAILLRRALDLWTGEPLDGVTATGLDGERTRLAELWVSVREDWFDAELSGGTHAELVGELSAMVTAHPLRERLAGQLMIALYRCHRQADALRAYQALHDRLADELGSEPCAELRALRARILRGDEPDPVTVPMPAGPPPPRIPAQLPAGVGHFTGRGDALADLTDALPEPDAEPRPILVTGAGGLGKTALVVHWARRVAEDRFPDGQIFLNLRGSGPEPARSAADTLAAALVALGVDRGAVPANPDDRAALYRTLVHGRRILVVADDARDVAQFAPLVPPTAHGQLIVTSRSRLPALAVTHAVHVLAIAPLRADEALALLREFLEPQRIGPRDAEELVRLCAGWPLPLRSAAVTLAGRPDQSLPGFCAEWAEDIDTLAVAGDTHTVHAALTHTHQRLDPAAGLLFAQLGSLASNVVDVPISAALAGLTRPRVRRLLDELVAANLIAPDGHDRYAIPGLIWRFAQRCGASQLGTVLRLDPLRPRGAAVAS